MATKYDQTPTSINSLELADAEQARLAAEALAEEQERAERLTRAGEVMGSLATEQARTDESMDSLLTPEEGGVVIEGHFGDSEASMQQELARLTEEAKARIEELNSRPEQLAA